MHKFTKMSNITGGKLAALLAAVVASASLTVHADDPVVRNWIGGEEGVANTPESPYTIQNLANWDGSGTIGYGYHNNLYLICRRKNIH